MAFRNTGPSTHTSGAVIARDRLVKPSGGKMIHCSAGDEPVGLSTEAITAADLPMTIYHLQGNIERVTASKAIAAWTAIYVAADGKVSDAAVGKQIGMTLKEAANVDGAIISAFVWGTRNVSDVLSSRVATGRYHDDFYSFDDTAAVGDYVEVSDGTPAVDVIDAVNGVLSIATGAIDNDENYISSMHEIFKFQTDKKLFFDIRVKLTEANVDDANIIIGVSDTVGANSLLDNGAGPMASYDGVVFSKVDGGTDWSFETSNAGTQNTLAVAGAFTSGAWERLSFLYDYNDGITAKVTPFVNGVAGAVQDLVIAGLAEMHLVFGAKAGGANAETLLVDVVDIPFER